MEAKIINILNKIFICLKQSSLKNIEDVSNPKILYNIACELDPNETQKTNKEEKKSKKKKKKNKKKKGVEEAQFPPKKAKKKNIKSDNNKIVNESSNNDIISVNNLNNDSNKNNKNNGIYIYSKEKAIDNEKIILEKKMIDSKDGLEKTVDEKENKEDNIDITKLNDQEINDLNYEIAIKIDKRTYFQYYWSLLKKKHLILFTFWPANDYNIYNIKVSLFLLSFGLFFSINGFFFTITLIFNFFFFFYYSFIIIIFFVFIFII